MTNKSQFGKWFEAQFGKRCAGRQTDAQLEAVISGAEHAMQEAKAELQARARWDGLKYAASCTRNASPDFDF